MFLKKKSQDKGRVPHDDAFVAGKALDDLDVDARFEGKKPSKRLDLPLRFQLKRWVSRQKKTYRVAKVAKVDCNQ